MTQPAPFEHDFRFDPAYGYDLPALLNVPAPIAPADFASFWRGTFDEVRDEALDLEVRPSIFRSPVADVSEVYFNSLGGVRLGGWLTVPHGPTAAAPGWVVGHGYGGRLAPSGHPILTTGPALHVCQRGFNLSAHPGIPGVASDHVLHGIARRETYVHRGCVADLWCAASAMGVLFPAIQNDLRYFGESFGGGIGAMALPWDERFRRACLDVPSFGNHPLRLQLPCVGSGEFVRFHARRHPEVLDVLRYFDAATAATFLQTPTFVAAALFDPAVPPPGQFAVYHALAGEKELFVRQAGHFAHPAEAAENAELSRRLHAWFARS